MSIDSGLEGEALAVEYLKKRGLTAVQQNYRCKLGEIDLIMKDEDVLVFVEVKYRRLAGSTPFASTLDNITFSKQTKLRRTALAYLQSKNLVDKIPCRFDVVAITAAQGKTSMEWVKNAF